ncbi:hypothetical protein UCMB321_4962 [Pseudomonas batumici]|uniref:Uncharacterized protein n=1 Tax=Pseudomonas batumici TaxID=226910 RepID=A0A0C2HVI7_9PSED|nr:hypothetical protein UCMB321_4962 [Pseudomonas batumici]
MSDRVDLPRRSNGCLKHTFALNPCQVSFISHSSHMAEKRAGKGLRPGRQQRAIRKE